MQWFKHNLSALVQIAVLSVAIVGTLVLLVRSWIPEQPAATHRQMTIRTELGDERSAEVILRHGKNDNGSAWTNITYRFGGAGRAEYRPDGTLHEFKIAFPDGSPQLHAVFAKDGTTIINGFERRADGSPVWKTERLTDGRLQTTSFWQSGNRFALVVSDPKEGSLNREFYYQNGKLQARQSYAKGDGNKLALVAEEVYAENGELQRLRKSPLGSTKALMSYYRYDGTLEYSQHWGPEPGAGIIRPHEGGRPPEVSALVATNIYGADGVTMLKQIGFEAQSTVVPWIAVINTDGSMDVTHYGINRLVTSKEHILSNGTIAAKQGQPRHPEQMESFDKKYQAGFPEPIDPTTDWVEKDNRSWLLESMNKVIAARPR